MRFTIENITGGLIKGCFPSCPQVFNDRNQKEIQAKFGAGIPKGASCSEMDIEKKRIQNEMNAIRGKITGGEKGKYWRSALGELENRLRDTENRIAQAKCSEIKAKQEEQRKKKEDLAALAQVTKEATTTSPLSDLQAKIQEQQESAPDYTKYIAIGIAGVFIIGAVFLLLKPSKAPVPAPAV